MSAEVASLIFLAIGVLVLLCLHAYLVLCETSLVRIRYGDADNDALEELRKRSGVAGLLENGDLAGRVVRFGKTLCTMGLGVLLVPMVETLFAFGGQVQPNELFLLLGSFVCAFAVHFFFAEIFPRGLGMRDPILGLRRSYQVLLFFRWLTMPAMWLFRRLKDLHFKRIGLEIEDELNPLDVDVQIRAMGEESSGLSPVVRKIVDRTLQMQDLVVHDVLLPRNQVVIYDLEEDLETNLSEMKDAGHTRFPLCRGDLDDCVGIIHIKDIFRLKGDWEAIDPLLLKRSIAQFPMETRLEDALQRMLRAKFHMALVADEFGRVIGVVTLESILESLVGDIQDEFDCDEELVVPLRKPDAFRVSGLTPLHDIEEELDLVIKNDDVSTIGGLVTAELGYIPKVGENLVVSGLRIKVVEADERRVISAELEKEREVDQKCIG